MKFLKKTLAYMLPAMMLLGGTSCSDFLDKAPENKVPEESIDYTNLANMYQPVSGVMHRYVPVACTGFPWPLSSFVTTMFGQDAMTTRPTWFQLVKSSFTATVGGDSTKLGISIMPLSVMPMLLCRIWKASRPTSLLKLIWKSTESTAVKFVSCALTLTIV